MPWTCREQSGHDFFTVFIHPCTNLPLYFKRWRFNINSGSGVASQSCKSGCLGDFWTLFGPVVLMRSGILRKGLPPQWQIQLSSEAQYRGELPLLFWLLWYFVTCPVYNPALPIIWRDTRIYMPWGSKCLPWLLNILVVLYIRPLWLLEEVYTA